MSTIRTGDFAQHTRTMGNIQEVQNRLRYANLQISTGKAAHSYAELGSASGTLMRTETALEQAEMFSDQNQLLANHLNLMDGALANAESIADEFRQAVIARRNDAGGSAAQLDLEAEGMMQRLANELNLTVDGRYAFAGSKTDTPPVDLAEMGDPANGSYYQGDHVALQARIDVRAEASYGVLADEAGFKNLFDGLQQAVTGHQTDDDTLLQAAAQLAERALDGIIASRSRLATVAARVESTRASQEGTKLYLQDALSQLTDTDVPAKMAQIAQDQVSLEASYSVMTRLNQLSLTDYLR